MGHSRYAVLFDLDGTLVDTAPDLVAALYAACDANDIARPPFEAARAQVANGGVGLVALALPDAPQAERDALRVEFLAHYTANVAHESVLYDSLAPLLEALDAASVKWGVVTNKPTQLSVALLDALGMLERCACIVGGDTLSVSKPNPAPLLYAADLIACAPTNCIYIGDHERDIIAARAAGMRSVGVGYGFLLDGDDPKTWGANKTIDQPHELAGALIALGLSPTQAGSIG